MAIDAAESRPSHYRVLRTGAPVAALIVGLAALMVHPGTASAATKQIVIHWTPAVVEDAPGDLIATVIKGGPGYIAAGRNEGQFLTAKFWTSVDGASWTAAPLVGGADHASVRSLIRHEPGYVAVGYSDDGPAAWTSLDGLTWARVTLEPTLGPSLFNDVTEEDGHLIAVGCAGKCESRDPFDAAAWTSDDGVTWSPSQVAGSTSALMNAVIAGPDRLVAVGVHEDVEPDPGGDTFSPTTAAWTSVDGVNWTRAGQGEEGIDGDLPGAGLGSANDVVFASDTYAAAGTVSAATQAWTSPDGVVWSDIQESVFYSDGVDYSEMSGIAPFGGGWLTTGIEERGERFDVGMWGSIDGTDWQTVNSPGEGQGLDMIVDGLTIVVVGGAAAASDTSGASAWIGTIEITDRPEPPSPPPPKAPPPKAPPPTVPTLTPPPTSMADPAVNEVGADGLPPWLMLFGSAYGASAILIRLRAGRVGGPAPSSARSRRRLR